MRGRQPWFNRQVLGWAMFDFANQAFTLVILTAMFQVYFIEYIVPGDTERGMFLWSLSGIATQVVLILVAPVLGALADFAGSKKRLLFFTYIGCVLFTASLSLIPPGAVAMGMALFVLAYLFYGAGENFMSSFLPELAAHRHMGKVSAFGWTLGYVGGLLCLFGAALINFFVEGAAGYRLVSLWAAVFFLVAALPTFLLLGERKQAEAMPPGQSYFTIGFHRLAETFHEMRSYRRLFHFLAVMALYFGGVQIVIWFAGSITRQLFGFGEREMGFFLLQISATAIIGAVLTGRYQDRVGAKNFILIVLVFWMATVLLAAFATEEWLFWVVGNMVGLGIGAIGTSSRAMVGLFSPEHKAAEFFGFYGLAHKLSAILGLAAFAGALALFEGNLHRVIASTSVFFVLGFLLMLPVDEKAGRTVALRATRAYYRQQKVVVSNGVG
jgi:MFS transporter, UMF1 family